MSNKLKSLTDYPPGQFQFTMPQSGWSATPGSFDSVVRQVIAHRIGNRALSKQYGLSTEYAVVSDEVNIFNAARCLASGWTNFVTEAPAPSFRVATPFKKLSQSAVAGSKKVVAGVKAVALWLGDGLKPVAQELAEQRAVTCSNCPKNGDPTFLERLSAIGAEEIRTMMAIRGDLGVKTQRDSQLQTCTACGCYLKLKVHCPIQHVTATMNVVVRAELHSACWILSESETKSVPVA